MDQESNVRRPLGLRWQDAQAFSALFLRAKEASGMSVQQLVNKANTMLASEPSPYCRDDPPVITRRTWNTLISSPRYPLNSYQKRDIARAFGLALNIPLEDINRVGGGI